jgi:hypothetical protein
MIGVRKIRILNPLIMMIGGEESTDELDWEVLWMLWGEDPVHPYKSAYDNIAERLLDLAGSGMKPAVGNSEKVPHSKRIPLDRASWINSDAGGVTYAPRVGSRQLASPLRQPEAF